MPGDGYYQTEKTHLVDLLTISQRKSLTFEISNIFG